MAAPHDVPTSLAFRRLTFRPGTILRARFSPDGKTVVYSAAWEGTPSAMYTVRTDGGDSRELGLGDASVASVSSGGELAIVRMTSHAPGALGTLARMQRADEGVAIMRTIEAIVPLAQIDPRAARRINADKALQHLAEINGAPPDILRSDEELAAMDEAEQEAIDTQTLIEAAPVAANSAKALMEAQALAQQQPAAGAVL